ncbi:MAG TPA: putative DNA binding domain-containing protein [Methanocorpusculum sp.]|nr:putative DNA binding domain-containing protein [Methanocorpusculum sp.]
MQLESDKIEYKREFPSTPEKFEKEVSAFLNTDGGTIYFGINDNGITEGIENPDELQLKLKDHIKNNISPNAIDYCKITTETKNDKIVILLKIEPGLEKPFYLNKYGMTPKGCFKRIGSAVEPMNISQIESILSKRVRNSLRNISSPNDELNFEQLRIYYQEKKKTLNEQFLKSLNLLTDAGKPNYAAYLLADENRNTILFAKYADKTRYNLLSNELFGDYCLVKSFKQLEGRLASENITFTKITAKERLERKLINEIALRESLLNALLHNDYANGSAPKVEFFSDRVEITSYGGLPFGITEEEFYSGRSYPRNPELMRVFRDLDIVEQLGSGIPRIMKEYGKEVFIISENFITVVLPFSHGFIDEDNNCTPEGLTEKQVMALQIIKDNPSITKLELAEKLKTSPTTVQKYINDLKKKGIIVRKGSKHSGYWDVFRNSKY